MHKRPDELEGKNAPVELVGQRDVRLHYTRNMGENDIPEIHSARLRTMFFGLLDGGGTDRFHKIAVPFMETEPQTSRHEEQQ